MSTLRTLRTWLGLSATPANNFTIRAPDDGSLRISRGNAGAEITDVLTVSMDNILAAIAHPATGDRTAALATMKKFADEFGALFTTAGWQKLPSGLIIQWGTVSPSASDTVITLPIAFPNAGLMAFASNGYTAGSGAVGYSAINVTNKTTITGRSSTSGLGWNWLAIGY